MEAAEPARKRDRFLSATRLAPEHWASEPDFLLRVQSKEVDVEFATHREVLYRADFFKQGLTNEWKESEEGKQGRFSMLIEHKLPVIEAALGLLYAPNWRQRTPAAPKAAHLAALWLLPGSLYISHAAGVELLINSIVQQTPVADARTMLSRLDQDSLGAARRACIGAWSSVLQPEELQSMLEYIACSASGEGSSSQVQASETVQKLLDLRFPCTEQGIDAYESRQRASGRRFTDEQLCDSLKEHLSKGLSMVNVELLKLLRDPDTCTMLNELDRSEHQLEYIERRHAWRWLWAAARRCGLLSDAMLLDAFAAAGEGSVLDCTRAMQGSPVPDSLEQEYVSDEDYIDYDDGVTFDGSGSYKTVEISGQRYDEFYSVVRSGFEAAVKELQSHSPGAQDKAMSLVCNWWPKLPSMGLELPELLVEMIPMLPYSSLGTVVRLLLTRKTCLLSSEDEWDPLPTKVLDLLVEHYIDQLNVTP